MERNDEAELTGVFPGCDVTGSVLLAHDAQGVLGFWESDDPNVPDHADDQGHVHENVMRHNGGMIRSRYTVGEACSVHEGYVHVSKSA